MKLVVLVHPGSHFGPGASEVSERVHQNVTDGLLEDVQSADGLLIIDGSLSDTVPANFQREVQSKLEYLRREGGIALRVFGCDGGEKPYAGWVSFGDSEQYVFEGQEDAAAKLSSSLAGYDEILVTGAWASMSGKSGCVNSVFDILEQAYPDSRVTVSENALYEEYMGEDFDL